MRIAEVYRNGDLAGLLMEHGPKNYSFRYEERYFADKQKPVISVTLPKNEQEFQSDHLFPFFFNMLSEGENKKLQCRVWKIDENDHSGLLAATVQFDTIGAVTVKPCYMTTAGGMLIEINR